MSEKTCFVVMPISDPLGYDRGHFSRVYEGLIKPVTEDEAGYKTVRASDVNETNLIHLDILQRLLKADLVVCDLSGRNPNVMFELGLRQAFDKPVVLLKDDVTESPFDVASLRWVNYHSSLRFDLLAEAKTALGKAVSSTMSGSVEGVNSLVRLLSLTAAAMSKDEAGSKEDAQYELITKQISSLAAATREIKGDLQRLSLAAQTAPLFGIGPNTGPSAANTSGYGSGMPTGAGPNLSLGMLGRNLPYTSNSGESEKG